MEIDVDNGVVFRYKGYTVKHWTPNDREKAGCLIKQCLESYGLRFEPFGADRDALEVEDFYYSENRGEFWVITDDNSGELVGTGAFYEIDYKEQVADEGDNRRVEIRKMYLAPTARGKRLGCTLLQKLEEVVAMKGYQEVIVETASVLVEACQMYKKAGYKPVDEGVEVKRCDRRLYKILN